MVREDVMTLARKAGEVGSVTHEEFAEYIVLLEGQHRVGDEWQAVEQPYMAVDGKLAMANEDHRRQGKRLDFGEPKVLLDNEEQLTLLVTVTSEIYGTRHGIATSRKQHGPRAEKEFPWEVAETSAIGRALTAMGYGLFPGAGLASAEDMLRAGANRNAPGDGGSENEAEREPRGDNAPNGRPMRHAPMSVNQRNKLI